MRDHTDADEPAVVTWTVDHAIPEWSELFPSPSREDAVYLAWHAEDLERRARSPSWRRLVPPQVLRENAPDRLAERLEQGRAWARELDQGATVRQLADREGVTGPWIRVEVLFARMDEPLTLELLRPGSWSAALSDNALREVARRKTPEAQAGLFWSLVTQLEGKIAETMDARVVRR